MTNDTDLDSKIMDQALQAAEAAIRELREERPEVRSTGALAYAAIKAALPHIRTAIAASLAARYPGPEAGREAQ